jgi:hypothetical protein
MFPIRERKRQIQIIPLFAPMNSPTGIRLAKATIAHIEDRGLLYRVGQKSPISLSHHVIKTQMIF